MKRLLYTCGAYLFIFIVTVGMYGFWLRAHWIRGIQESTCQSNLKLIALGIFMYEQDYNDTLPPAIFPGKNVGWANGLQPYLKSYRVFQCPIESHDAQKIPKPDQPGFTDYWLNSNIARLEDKKVIDPSQLIMLGDGDGGSSASTASYAINQIPSSWQNLPVPPMTRHFGSANYAFADGHIKKLKPDQVSQLPSSDKNPVFTFMNK